MDVRAEQLDFTPAKPALHRRCRFDRKASPLPFSPDHPGQIRTLTGDGGLDKSNSRSALSQSGHPVQPHLIVARRTGDLRFVSSNQLVIAWRAEPGELVQCSVRKNTNHLLRIGNGERRQHEPLRLERLSDQLAPIRRSTIWRIPPLRR